jgi:membrane associated rhomboid family serine protease
VTGLGAGLIQIIVAYLRMSSIMADISAEEMSMIVNEMAYYTPAGKEFLILLNIPTVGASGAVFGILLAFGMLFPNTMLYIYFAIPIKAKWFVIAYGAIELFSGIANRPGDNVAHFAHLGGMLFGFILIKYWQKRSNRFY